MTVNLGQPNLEMPGARLPKAPPGAGMGLDSARIPNPTNSGWRRFCRRPACGPSRKLGQDWFAALPLDVREVSDLPHPARVYGGLRPQKLGRSPECRKVLPGGRRPPAHQAAKPRTNPLLLLILLSSAYSNESALSFVCDRILIAKRGSPL